MLLLTKLLIRSSFRPPVKVSQLKGCPTRSVSILSSLNSSPVLISSDRDVYTNLAIEHWLYMNLRFNANQKESPLEQRAELTSFNHPIVFLWIDEPCIVMGRHQNPWIETHLDLINKLGINLARRHSGGGCVYHDENNINISIIGSRKVFENRQENLKFLANLLDENYGIKCEPNKRHDLIHSASGLKMSGSAAKLGRFNSYHHFTLLVDTDKEIMQAAIRQKQQDFIDTNSSVSTRSSVINLKELKSNLGVNAVMSDLAQAYGKLYESNTGESPPGGKLQGDQNDYTSLKGYREELTSWKWIYGMTPKFQLKRCVNLLHNGQKVEAQFKVQINRGVFEKFEINCDLEELRSLTSKFDHLIGTSFIYKDAMISVVKMLQLDDNDLMASKAITGNEQIFATFLLQMIHEANVCLVT